MGPQLVLLELELLRLSARGWNRQDLEQRRPRGICVFNGREGLKHITVSGKKGGQNTQLLELLF